MGKDNKFNANHFFNQSFDASKFKKETVIKGGRLGRAHRQVFYADGSDALANTKKLYVSFLHESSKNSVFFKAFITSFNETYTPTWKSEQVFGRSDPLHSFVQTSRNINLTLMVPAASESEAFENLGRVQKLVQFLYPNYENVQEAQTISQGPLVRLKVMNLLQNLKNAGDVNNASKAKSPEDFYKAYKSIGPDPNLGQLGFINSLTVNHNIGQRDAGVFEKVDRRGTDRAAATSFLQSPNQGGVTAVNTILPKNIELVINFTPIHEHPLGWNNKGRFAERSAAKDQKVAANMRANGEMFPYGIITSSPATDEENASKTGEEAEQETAAAARSEQQKQNAEARYGGMFGGARENRDRRHARRAQAAAAEALGDFQTSLSDRDARRYARQTAKSTYLNEQLEGTAGGREDTRTGGSS